MTDATKDEQTALLTWEDVRYSFAVMLLGATGKPRAGWERVIDQAAEGGVLRQLRDTLSAGASILGVPRQPKTDSRCRYVAVGRCRKCGREHDGGVDVVAPVPQCWCHACRPLGFDRMEMVLCPDCGNKRCPKANNHRYACSSSNDLGQPGSAYSDVPYGLVALPLVQAARQVLLTFYANQIDAGLGLEPVMVELRKAADAAEVLGATVLNEPARKRTWPEARRVSRRDDMSPDGKLDLMLQEDGDVLLQVMKGHTSNNLDDFQQVDLEFCSPGAGGGRSSRTREALVALMVAVEADNAQYPIASDDVAVPGQAGGDAEYQSWVDALRATLGPALPACNTCGDTGVMVQDDATYVCECGGSGVQMNKNEPYARQPDWKLHRCPDGNQCRSEHPGGCADGWCDHFGVEPESVYSNIRPSPDEEPRDDPVAPATVGRFKQGRRAAQAAALNNDNNKETNRG